MIKVGLIGFGKTGKAVASALLQSKSIELCWIIRKSKQLNHRLVSEFLDINGHDSAEIHSLDETSYEKVFEENPVSIIIDFSIPEAIMHYGKLAAKKSLKIISAISHYEDYQIEELKKLAKNTTVFWSPNITLGVNYLIFAAKYLKLIAPQVDIEIIEEHFKTKAGISGTAIKIAEAIDADDIKINSVRAGGIVGKHEIIFGFPYQTVRFIHESIAREAFGNGVIFVSENLIHNDKGFFTFEDILLPKISAQLVKAQ